MEKIAEVPDCLMKGSDQIVGCAAKQRKQQFKASDWRKWLGKETRRLEDHLDIMADLEYIVKQSSIGLDRYGLDRCDLERIAREAVKDQHLEHYRRLFLASMIWGYGGDHPAGYGPLRTAKMLASEDFKGTLKEASDLIRSGKIGRAYDRFVSGEIEQCRAPFFTKYFYFLGHAVGGDTYPLILDSKVDGALKQLVDKSFLIYSRRGREEYLQYLALMGEWARRLGRGCTPDDIECFLYEHSASRHKREIN